MSSGIIFLFISPDLTEKFSPYQLAAYWCPQDLKVKFLIMIALLMQEWRKKQCTVTFSTCKDDSNFQDLLDVTAHINFKDKHTPDYCEPNCPVSTASHLHSWLNLEQLRNLAHFYFLFPLSAFASLQFTV